MIVSERTSIVDVFHAIISNTSVLPRASEVIDNIDVVFTSDCGMRSFALLHRLLSFQIFAVNVDYTGFCLYLYLEIASPKVSKLRCSD